MNHPVGPGAAQLARDPGRTPDSGQLHSERVWEQRRALGRRLASLRSRSGFSQWEFAPLTGYSRSTLSDAELGRHRLRREFWERCDEALAADGVLTAAYDRIEVAATAVRRSARSQAQAAREEQATRRLQALLPAPGAAALGAGGTPGQDPVAVPAPAGPAPEAAPDGIVWGVAGSVAAAGVVPGVTASGGAVPDPAGGTAAGRAAARGTSPAEPVLAGAASPELTARLVASDAPSAVTRVEQCPHCRQPVTVIIVAAAPPAAG